MSEIIVTYCSKEKNSTEDTLPAIELYRSDRITSVATIAQLQSVQFYILSGKFGLVHSTDALPYYDQLLKDNNVAEVAKKVADRLQIDNISKINFYTQTLEQDPQLASYWKCIHEATQNADCELEFFIL